MVILKKKEAFARAVAAFGPWREWTRSEHVAYGLIRGVPYSAMERCSNDDPNSFKIDYKLWELGAWPEHPAPPPNSWKIIPSSCRAEVYSLVKWVKKKPRVKKSQTYNLPPRSLEDVAP